MTLLDFLFLWFLLSIPSTLFLCRMLSWADTGDST